MQASDIPVGSLEGTDPSSVISGLQPFNPPLNLGLDWRSSNHNNTSPENEEEQQARRRHLRYYQQHEGQQQNHRQLPRTQRQVCAQPPCYLKQLALLVRFKDHKNRKLPSPEDFDVFFGRNGPTSSSAGGSASKAALTGSVSDVFRANSFDTFVIDTKVTPWITISCTEADAAANEQGFNQPATRKCWAEALKTYVRDYLKSSKESLSEMFDDNNDGFLDALAIVTSGVAAENNGQDCEFPSQDHTQRIWSHAVPSIW